MSRITLRSLSPELLSNCLSRLSLHDLTSVSLVSREIQTLAFPSLYQTVYLCLAPHIEQISLRLFAENESTRLRVGTNLRHLVFDDRYGDSDDRSVTITRLQYAISKLERLSHLYWDCSWLPEDPYVFKVFQRSCPALRSVSLRITSERFDFNDEEYLDSLQRQDEHCSSFNPGPDEYSELPKPLITMIKRSPNLRTLELDLKDVSMDHLKWSPDQLCSSLKNTTFPELCVFRALGAAEPEWQSFFEEPDESSYRTFFQRHPNLHTISMSWIREHSWPIEKAEQLAALFPSLRHFEGPAFICQALASSGLATQLESLSLLDRILEDDEIVEFAENAVEMPNLQSLSFALESEELDSESLSKVLSLSPSLKKLAVWSVTHELNELVDILKHAPNLEEFTIYIDTMLQIVKAVGKTSASELVHELALQLPNLRMVHDCSQPELQRRWEIHRTSENNVRVAHVQLVREGPPRNPYPILSETICE
ncbi:F-box-like protein [Ceratobasidium sp. AG-Ba]|nr:F-box-like protein [Ceratobasidium sp. AG-Ba]QRW04785.1 F-box-like protein [Ceratobasidium sp. AG-Ba]